MSISVSLDSIAGEPTLHLEGDLTIQFIQDWFQELESKMDSDSRVLDLSGIRKIDTSGVQLLIFLKKKMDSKGKRMILINHSVAIKKTWDLLGLISFFGDKIKIKKEEREAYSFSYGTKK